jgi:hypothetical protein
MLDSAGTLMIYYVHNKGITNNMKNGITLTHLATSYPIELPLNGKEMQLAMDKNPATIDKSWSLMCESVYSREGIMIEGNYELETLVVNGSPRPLH